MADGKHYAGFKDYQKLGGLSTLLKETGLVLISEKKQ